jgi:hypothetical protein
VGLTRGAAALGIVLLAGACLLAGGCGTTGASPASQAASASFLSSVHNNAPDIGGYRSDVALIRMGHAACDGFRTGVSFQQLADRLVLIEGRHPVPTGDLGALITAAVDSFCPQYQSLVH